MNHDKNRETISEEEVTMRDLIFSAANWFKYLLSNSVIILLAVLIGGALGLTYSFFRKPVYKAELSFALEDEKATGGGISAALGLASQFGIDLGGGGGGAFSGDNLLTLMRSRSMIESTLLSSVVINGKTQTLAHYYLNFNKLRQTWSDNPLLTKLDYEPNANRENFSLQQDSVLGVIYDKLIKGNLTVDKIDKKLSIITVRVNSTDEIFSKLFTEGLVKNVANFYVQTKTKKSVQNVGILQHQTDSVRRQLNSAINGVASSTDVNPNANPSLQILRVPSQRRQVDVQANTAILTELVKNLELSKISLRRETPLIQIIDEPILPLEKDKVGKLKGIVVGGMLFGFFCISFLIVKRVLNKIMND